MARERSQQVAAGLHARVRGKRRRGRSGENVLSLLGGSGRNGGKEQDLTTRTTCENHKVIES